MMRYCPCQEISQVQKEAEKGIKNMQIVNNLWKKKASGQRRHKHCYFPFHWDTCGWVLSQESSLRPCSHVCPLLIVRGRTAEIWGKNEFSIDFYGNSPCMKESHCILISWQVYSVVHGSSVRGYEDRNTGCALNHSQNESISQRLLIVCYVSYWASHYSEGKPALREKSLDIVYGSQTENRYTETGTLAEMEDGDHISSWLLWVKRVKTSNEWKWPSVKFQIMYPLFI